MERRSFLASLAALFVARKLPAAIAPAPQIGDIIELRHALFFGDGHFTRESVAYSIDERGLWSVNAVYVPRVKVRAGVHTMEEMREWTPDVWGDMENHGGLTITTTP